MKNTAPLLNWKDPTHKAGTMVRTALWLISEIGVGNSFTKEQHRAAFAGIAQADRRLRDLRKFGWVIHTSLEDVSLNSKEQRLVAIGVPVWESAMRKTVNIDHVTAKNRMAAFAYSNYQCSICGLAGGEHYPDIPGTTAVLGISKRQVSLPNNQVQSMLVTECKRCSAGTRGDIGNIPELLANLSALSPSERALFARWTENNRRSQLDSIWAQFRLLPAAAQDQVRQLFKQKQSGRTIC